MSTPSDHSKRSSVKWAPLDDLKKPPALNSIPSLHSIVSIHSIPSIPSHWKIPLIAGIGSATVLVFLMIIVLASTLNGGSSSNVNKVVRCVPMRLKMGGNLVDVPCEDDPDGGGAWTVFQRRGQFGNPERYFSDKTWAQYQAGFGDVKGEYWLGLDNLADITTQGKWQLRIDLNDWDGKNYSSIYKSFQIQPEPLYRLQLSGFNANLSTSGDSLTHSVHNSNGMAFSTKDRDNDACSHTDCANTYAGAWWYNCCQKGNLNGINYKKQENNTDAKGIYWKYGGDRGYGYLTWKSVQMKMRKNLDYFLQ